MREIEGMTAKYIADAKELAEVHIGAAVDETYSVLEKRHELSINEINAATNAALLALASAQSQTKVNYWIMGGIAIAAVLIGFFVGKIY